MTDRAVEDNPVSTTPAPPGADPACHPLALLLREDDAVVSEMLPRWIKTDRHGPHDDIFWQPSVQARVGLMEDASLTPLLLELAGPDYVGLDLLFDDRILARLSVMRPAHLHSTFLPYARKLPGFKESERDWRRMVDESTLRQRQQGAYAVLIPGADLQEEAIDWLWDPYIAKKTIIMLDGDPGVGKTMLACQLAASVSRGYPLPDQAGHMTLEAPAPGDVLLVGMEDHLGSVVKKRLDHCQADMRKLTFCNEIVNAAGEPRPFTLSDLRLLQDYLERCRPTLVYIDSIQGVLGEKVDIGSPNKIKALLIPLEQLAQTYNCAIVCSRHPSKPGQNVSRLIHRGMGSQSFIGAARSGIFVEEHPGEPTQSLMVHYKSNMGPKGRTQIFSKAYGAFHWCGVTRVGEAVLAGAGRGPNPHALLEACFWLEHRLASGHPQLSTELEQAADAEEIGEGALKRAKKALGVVSTQATGALHGGWWWSLPPLRITPSEPTEASDATEPTDAPEDISNTYEDSIGQKDPERREEDPPSGVSEDSEDSVASVGSEVHEGALRMLTPCANCGASARWEDNGIWRCSQCWPRGTC
jgi:AAA domain